MSDHPCSDMRRALRTMEARALEAIEREKGGGLRIVSASVGVRGISALTWLRSRPDLTRFYWSGRDDNETVAGLGVADRWGSVDGCTHLRKKFSKRLQNAAPSCRYYGGMAFDQSGPKKQPWNAFGTCQFILPRFELRSDGHNSKLICNMVFPQDAEDREALVREFVWPALPPVSVDAPLPFSIGRTDRPDEIRWAAMVERALRAFRQPELCKVVYARRARFRMDAAMDPVQLLGNMIAHRKGSFQFFFQVADGPAFVCNSPERLFRRLNGDVESEAVAGTWPRSGSIEEDDRRACQLMACKKERHEHELVRMGLQEQLAPHLTAMDVDSKPAVMRLASSLHLHSKLHATVRAGVTSLDVLAGLHPTPAVGGYPTKPALAEIRAEEPFDRGWYAGPVGWIGCDAAEFAVGIRSGLIKGDELTVYAGAGIVQGSTAEREWQEVEHKIGSFMQMIGLHGCCALVSEP